jgi:Tol biopolymer transport system component
VKLSISSVVLPLFFLWPGANLSFASQNTDAKLALHVRPHSPTAGCSASGVVDTVTRVGSVDFGGGSGYNPCAVRTSNWPDASQLFVSSIEPWDEKGPLRRFDYNERTCILLGRTKTSPDGRYVVTCGSRPDFPPCPQLLIGRVDGGDEKAISPGGRASWCWSPRADKLGLVVQTEDDSSSIGYYDIASENLKLVKPTGFIADGMNFQWLADDKHMVFEGSASDGYITIWILDTDEMAAKRLTQPHCGSPRVDPSGTRIAYLAFTSDKNVDPWKDVDLWITGPDGSEKRELVHSPPAVEGIVWSPDGERILFTTPHREQLYVAEVSSGKLLLLEDGPYLSVLNPLWSPDGTKIAYALGKRVSRTQGPPELRTRESAVCVVNADGSGKNVLLDVPDIINRPIAWTDDGMGLVVNSVDGRHNTQKRFWLKLGYRGAK